MKRKPHPDNPYSTFAPRKKGIRKVSVKKAKEKRETDALRHAYIEAGGMCERCYIAPATDPHEIGAGSARHLAVYELNARLYLCPDCHERLQGKPATEQIAVRVRAMVRTINQVRDRFCTSAEAVGLELIRRETNGPIN